MGGVVTGAAVTATLKRPSKGESRTPAPVDVVPEIGGDIAKQSPAWFDWSAEESGCSTSVDGRSRSRLGKRTREESIGSGSDSDTEIGSSPKEPAYATGRGRSGRRGRPVRTSARVAQASARELLKNDRRKKQSVEAETEAEGWSLKVQKALNRAKYTAREQTAQELVQAIRTATDTILHCAKRSGNVKGVFHRNFNDAAALIKAAVESLAERTLDDEVRRLSEANKRLAKELEDLRKESSAPQQQRRKEESTPPASIPASDPMDISIIQSSQLLEREQLERDIMAKCGAMMSARIEGLNDRLLPEKRRIPLAADQRKDDASDDANFPPLPAKTATPSPSTKSVEPQPSTSGEGGNKAAKKAATKTAAAKAVPKAASKVVAKAASMPAEKAGLQKAQLTTERPITSASQPAAKAPSAGKVTAPTSQPVKGAKTPGKKVTAPASTSKPGRASRSRVRNVAPTKTPAREELRPLPTPPTSMDEGWTTVVKRGSKKTQKGAEQTQQASAKPTKTAVQKLRPPRSSAIVLTLLEGAEEKGVTYQSVIRDARSRINIDEIGITSLKFTKAKTGGKLLEIPGSTSGDKADALANKLKEILPADLVRVTRPVKTADVRISGLDDATTCDEVAAAVAKVGNCAAEAVRVGEIRQSFTGSGSVVVKVPVAVAKKIGQGRLVVGWVSARVQVLENRPMRCYRCLEGGHVRAQCQSETDRSELCYRCGRPDHTAKECSAALHCSVCADHGKPADHKAGGKNCFPPKSNRKAAKPIVQSSAGQVEAMDTAK
ncbi:hypothetical protein ABMA27_010118 [Loxostege sticticalis]|uniref:CCHC-type domain-containing protein n=1 Tax=Loxostege sticticalis TaxID=481309 RepID=A0ABR3H4N9_LOXSC